VFRTSENARSMPQHDTSNSGSSIAVRCSNLVSEGNFVLQTAGTSVKYKLKQLITSEPLSIFNCNDRDINKDLITHSELTLQ
jgi:hypothetical protein